MSQKSLDLPAHMLDALTHFCSGVRSEFGPRLTQLVLFGSAARGEMRVDSDIDVLVEIENATRADFHKVDAITGDTLTQFDVVISPLAMSKQHFESLKARERRIVSEIEQDGISL